MLACLATSVLWVRSYWQRTWVSISRYHSWELELSRGNLIFDVLLNYPAVITESKAGTQSRIIGPARPYASHWELGLENSEDHGNAYFFWNIFGFAWNGIGIYPIHGGESRGVQWCVPCWFVWLMTALVPIFRIWKMRRRASERQRLENHLCLNCGYDVRATPQRCPECGARAPKSTPMSG
jgi:hypothetical protein